MRIQHLGGVACLALAASLLVFTACQGGPGAGGKSAEVDAERLRNAATEPGQWLMDGRDYTAQRFSPLKAINESNVSQLGLAWYADLDTYRGVEATPLFVDGVIYNVSAWNIAYAHDARTGRLLWTYDPEVPRDYGRIACCEPVARGLAFWKGKVIIATLDGRLIALNAKNGRKVWEATTFERDQPWSITGAPRVFDGLVVVGNGGADLGVRGFVSAWDADTGEFRWKFWLVPGDPANGPDGAASDSIMEMAAKTWTGEWWKLGGGGTAWDSIAWCTSAPATARRWHSAIAARRAATTCSSAPSWRWMRRPALIAGITRKCRRKTGTTPAHSPSCRPTSRSRAGSARC
jgi:quinohemoprotein ethanol dehydrogenase